jgi:hypothetical protein
MDAVIVNPFEDDDAIAQVNKVLYDLDVHRHQQFVKMDNSSAGGSKFASMTVYQACFNHMRVDEIVNAFNSANWQHRTPVLIIDDEHLGFQVHYKGEMQFNE